MNTLLLPYHGEVYLTSKYGERTLYGVKEFHQGVDLTGVDSKVLYAPCDGKVVMSEIRDRGSDDTRTWEWGNFVAIDTGDNLRIFMCHMRERNVEAGQIVKAGDVVGVEGNTGYSFGSHCHFEVRKNNVPIDPTELLGIKNEVGIYENTTLYFGIPGDGNTPHDWSKDAVEFCVDNEIMLGSSNTKADFRLNDPITREEMCVMLYRFYMNVI